MSEYKVAYLTQRAIELLNRELDLMSELTELRDERRETNRLLKDAKGSQ